ncbi:hypothetical protein QR680_008936 [Steinernema hermaphroditum]|uniref:RNase NYN domain-containing protein n=1 Tax=Steinernema hermaphroditum TaxID=289476 RepID=A0AA39IJZ8_9BILA|nr:hypothetical protein QR680_008936 [Steinernema hermaphroditum]
MGLLDIVIVGVIAFLIWLWFQVKQRDDEKFFTLIQRATDDIISRFGLKEEQPSSQKVAGGRTPKLASKSAADSDSTPGHASEPSSSPASGPAPTGAPESTPEARKESDATTPSTSSVRTAAQPDVTSSRNAMRDKASFRANEKVEVISEYERKVPRGISEERLGFVKCLMASSRASASSNSQAPSWRVRTPRERSEQSGGHLAFTPKADRTILESLPPFVRRCAVIDGMNLLHTASRSSKADRYYELDAIVFLVAARELLLKDFDVRFFLPIKRIRSVKNKNVIQDLTHLNIFEYTYSNYDDVVILQYAASAGGFVVSRDKFRDVLPRMSYVFHMKERLCHASFLPADNCRMSLTVDVEDDSEEMEPWIEDEPTERERRDDVTALLEEATAAEPRAGMFYSQKGDFDYDSALYTRAFFTPERRRALLEAVEETLERLFYNARTRDTGLSLTSLVYLTCYYKPDELEEAFHTMQTKERQSMRRVLDAKDEIKFWFKKAVKARCVEKALQKEPTTFAEMLKLCNEELLKESKGVARGKNMTQRTYDDPLHPTMTATEKALCEFGVDF